MSLHILYCNDNADVLVLDLPASIARAQASTRQLRSTPALRSPFVTPEPRGPKREALSSAVPADEANFHLGIQKTLQSALSVLREHWHEDVWCHPRACLDQDHTSVEHVCLSHDSKHVDQSVSPPLVLSPTLNSVCCLHDLSNTVVYNPSSSPTDLAVSNQGLFTIPPRSVLLNASIESGVNAFVDAVHCLLPKKSFDLVLLDPPWTNRSVRNSRVYRSAEYQLSDPFGQVIPLVSTYLSEGGYVATWITNKATIRSSVLEQCRYRGLVLEEEWIWLKVTSKGEPVTPLDGLWRKPYEVLLLFRHGSKQQEVTRRVGIAVPDLHSRKPSLKSMFEQLLPQQYTALEVFARSLTAGWWSWGDEVLKFQHESQWS